ncbi:hypothetical protein ACO0R3_002464 [Hanseniaspora guilliermondii]
MKRYKGQKIKEGIDFMRIPSLTLTPDELDSIPEPPSFEDLAINSKEDLSRSLSIRKQSSRNFSRGKLSKTIKFQQRLSSLASVYSSNTKEVADDENVDKRSSSVRVRKFTPTMNKLVEENYSSSNSDIDHSITVYQTQLHQPVFIEPVDTSADFLYGDTRQEEEQILSKRLVSGNQTTETFKTANEVLINEIVDSYKNDHMEVVDKSYQPFEKVSIDLPLSLNDKSIVLQPPIPMLNSNHQHTTSIHTVSDMSTLPEKLFSSPEVENRSSASSVYSELSDTEYTDEDDIIRRETIHKNIYSNEMPKLNNIVDIYDDEYIIDLEKNKSWILNSVEKVKVSKPKVLKWEDEFESEDEEFVRNRIVSSASNNNYTYMRHLDYVDNNSVYADDIISDYSERTSFTTNTTTTFNSKEFYEAHEYVEISVDKP